MFLFKLELVAYLLLCLYFRQVLAAEEVGNVFAQNDFDLESQDDDVHDRHPRGQPTYNSDNPPPTDRPSMKPSMMPSSQPSSNPTKYPSVVPSFLPTGTPSVMPSELPSDHPSKTPSTIPTLTPSNYPSTLPSSSPSFTPSKTPSTSPSMIPTLTPSNYPSTLPSSSPSFTPSARPSLMPSVFTCKIDSNGDFGNTTDNFKQRVSFRYEVELNKTLLQTNSDAYINEIDTSILPLVEDSIVKLLFPYLFQICIDEDFNSTSSFTNVEGVSTMPKDILNIDFDCNNKTSLENLCFPIDSEFSLFFKSRRRLSEDRDVNQLKEIIKGLMAEGALNNAHPAIEKITYVENNALPIIDLPGKIVIGDLSTNREGNSSWLMIALGIGGFGLLVAFISLMWRKRKNKEDDESDESSSVATP